MSDNAENPPKTVPADSSDAVVQEGAAASNGTNAKAAASGSKKDDQGLLLSLSQSSESSLSDDEEGSSYRTDDRACLNVLGDDLDYGAGEDWPERRGFTARPGKPGSPPPAIRATTIKEMPTDQLELMQAVKAHRERSAMLAMLHQELSQELADVMEERHSLELQIDELRNAKQTAPASSVN